MQEGLGLRVDPRAPLVGCITRLVPQKGCHLIRHALFATRDAGGQVCCIRGLRSISFARVLGCCQRAVGPACLLAESARAASSRHIALTICTAPGKTAPAMQQSTGAQESTSCNLEGRAAHAERQSLECCRAGCATGLRARRRRVQGTGRGGVQVRLQAVIRCRGRAKAMPAANLLYTLEA